jgi:hypothetical protein
VVSFTPLTLYPPYPLDTRLRRPQSRSGLCEENKYLALPGIEAGPCSPQPITKPTELSGLLNSKIDEHRYIDG